jgi:hypothetical protein
MTVRGRYTLGRAIRTELDAKYGTHHSVVQVSKLLSDLPGKIPDLAEKTFLAEALKCYRVEAYRSSIVMTWNLAYSHFLHWILKDPARLAVFNATITVRYPKKTGITIAAYDDFGDALLESEVIEICGTAGLLNKNIKKILKEKLDKRNTAAHPSTVVVVQSQADDVVTDLVNNVGPCADLRADPGHSYGSHLTQGSSRAAWPRHVPLTGSAGSQDRFQGLGYEVHSLLNPAH